MSAKPVTIKCPKCPRTVTVFIGDMIAKPGEPPRLANKEDFQARLEGWGPGFVCPTCSGNPEPKPEDALDTLRRQGFNPTPKDGTP